MPPRLRFVVENAPHGGASAGVFALRGRDEVGAIFSRAFQGALQTSAVRVAPTARRQGLATQLYTRLAALACKRTGQPLFSDDERSAADQAFWVKQVEKGRARCVVLAKHPVVPLDYESVVGRGGCLRYQLNNCQVRDLRGVAHTSLSMRR